jgi:hypothetical protein
MAPIGTMVKYFLSHGLCLPPQPLLGGEVQAKLPVFDTPRQSKWYLVFPLVLGDHLSEVVEGGRWV